MKHLAVKFGALMVLLGCAAFAQNTGSIGGNVTLSTGGPLPSARVTLENLTTGVRVTVTTDSSGTYRFDNLPGGRYRISVSTAQLAGAPSEDITLDITKSKTVNVTVQA